MRNNNGAFLTLKEISHPSWLVSFTQLDIGVSVSVRPRRTGAMNKVQRRDSGV